MPETAKKIGVLMLNTTFPRIPGDIGNPASFNYPVIYQAIKSATPTAVVTQHSIKSNIESDIKLAAHTLIEQDVSVITTSCGFLSPMQPTLAKLAPMPVITSSLTLLPLLAACHGGIDQLGILTFDKNKLNIHHLGDYAATAIEGLLASDSLKKTIAQNLPELNRATALTEVLNACDRLTTASPTLKAVILECTNLSPYKQEIRHHTGLAVYDIVDAIHWLLDSQP